MGEQQLKQNIATLIVKETRMPFDKAMELAAAIISIARLFYANQT